MAKKIEAPEKDKPTFPILEKYGVKPNTSPPYVIAGRLFIGSKSYTGLVGFAANQIHAYIIRRELNKAGHQVSVERTEHHPAGPTLNVEEWLENRRRNKRANV
jgi:hypothetical protein